MKALIFALVVFGAGAAQAATLDFKFSFFNWANGGGDVTGIVRGLEDNSTGAAQSFEILSNSDGFGVGGYIVPGARISNTWTLKNGRILEFAFEVLGRDGGPVADSSITFGRYVDPFRKGRFGDYVGLSHIDNGTSETSWALADVRFAPDVAGIPLPASLLALISCLAALTGPALRKRAPQVR